MTREAWHGRVIGGRFRLDAKIGRGGYGEVFRARQLSVDRDVALKLVRAKFAHDGAVRRRFEREARLASRIRHPNAVRVIDFGEDGDELFLVMELVEGATLKQRAGTHSAAEVRALALGIASALDAAHRVGVVHRDLKPSNVLIEPDGNPVVIDFGLVKAFMDDTEDDVTQSSALVGTPAYMSPETVLGRSLDGRADLYSLGVMLYELLCGERPIRGNTAMETAMRHVDGVFEPLDGKVNAGTSRQLIAIVHKLLATDPAGRFSSAAALITALEAFGVEEDARATVTLDVERTQAPVAGPARSTVQPGSRRGRAPAGLTPKRLWAGAFAALLVVALGFVLSQSRAREAEQTATHATEASARPGDAPSAPVASEVRATSEITSPAATSAAIELEAPTNLPPVPLAHPPQARGPASRSQPAVAREHSAEAATPAPATTSPEPPPRATASPAQASTQGQRSPDISAAPTGTMSINSEPWGEIVVRDVHSGRVVHVGTDAVNEQTFPTGMYEVRASRGELSAIELVRLDEETHKNVSLSLR